MLKTLYQWAKDTLDDAHPYDGRPPSRLGCVDVRIYADPQDEDDVEFLNHVQQLDVIRDQGRTPPAALIDYFAERYLQRDILQHANCSFETYLDRPLLVEHMRDDLAPTPSHS